MPSVFPLPMHWGEGRAGWRHVGREEVCHHAIIPSLQQVLLAAGVAVADLHHIV